MAQDDHGDGHAEHHEGTDGIVTAPVTDVWSEYMTGCAALLTDPQGYVATANGTNADIHNTVNRSEDGQVIVMSKVVPSGVTHMMELVGVPGELHVLCRTSTEPQYAMLADPVLSAEVDRQAVEELKALVAVQGAGQIVGGRLPLNDGVIPESMRQALPDGLYANIFGIQADLAGTPRFIYADLNAGALALTGHYILRPGDVVTNVTRAAAPSDAAPEGAAATANAPADGAQAMMRAVAEQCLRNYETPDDAVAAIEGLGLQLVAGMDEGAFEFSGSGVMGQVSTVPELYCSIQSTEVPLDAATAIGTGLATTLFPDMTEASSPEGGTGPCDGMSIFAPRRVIWISYAQAGNSGACVNDGTSAMIIQ